MTQHSHDSVFVRTVDAETLPPPQNQSGIRGWLWRTLFYSFMDYSSVGASVRSLAMLFFTVLVSYVGITQLWYLLDFVFLSAVWSDPTGIKREACWTVSQGGTLPDDWHAACWHSQHTDTLWSLGGFCLLAHNSNIVSGIMTMSPAHGVGPLYEAAPKSARVGTPV